MDAEASTSKNIYFISLLGADQKGKPRRLQFIFDLVTKWYDFRNTNVKMVDVRMLCDNYENTTGKDSSDVDVYTISLQFIKDHPNSHYLFDEVPFIENGEYNFIFGK